VRPSAHSRPFAHA